MTEIKQEQIDKAIGSVALFVTVWIGITSGIRSMMVVFTFVGIIYILKYLIEHKKYLKI